MNKSYIKYIILVIIVAAIFWLYWRSSVKSTLETASENNFFNKIDSINRDLCQSQEKSILEALDTNKFSLIKILMDFSNNTCSLYRKNNVETLLNFDINQDNFIAVATNYEALLSQSPGMAAWDLFRKSIEELKNMPKEEAEPLRKALFFALNNYINNASSLLEIAISHRTLTDLGHEGLISKKIYDQLPALRSKFDDTRQAQVQKHKATSGRYAPGIFQMPLPQKIKHLGYAGVKELIYDGLKDEYAMTKDFRDDLKEIMKSITSDEP